MLITSVLNVFSSVKTENINYQFKIDDYNLNTDSLGLAFIK